MIRGLGLLSLQEIEIVIPEWWTWWRWLVRSPTAWKASLEGLKVLTLVPNPTGISPQTTWRVGEEGYSCISIKTCPCINTSYVVWLCLVVCLLVVWVDNWLFVRFYIKFFFIADFYHYFFVSKIQKHIKNRKSKSLINFVEFFLIACFALYLCTNSLVHLRA